MKFYFLMYLITFVRSFNVIGFLLVLGESKIKINTFSGNYGSYGRLICSNTFEICLTNITRD